jgi:hypothetical protein
MAEYIEPKEYEPTEEEKRTVIEGLIEEGEIIMCLDGNYYRPLWKNEYHVNTDVMSEKDYRAYIEKYQPYEPTLEDVDRILENGSLEWEIENGQIYVKIWW